MKQIFSNCWCIAVLWLCTSTSAYAIDFGPFTLRGFGLAQLNWATNQCLDCQKNPDEDRQRSWADYILAGKKYEPKSTVFSLFQPYLELRPIYLGKGFQISALLSQRWRDGMIDLPGIWYEKNVTLRQEYYGAVTIGAFPSRGWSVADYPYGSNIGLADAWGSSGSGYGLMANAIRYSAPILDFFRGQFHWEITHDIGDGRYETDSSFWEAYAQYAKGALVTDWVYQLGKNGRPGSWTHGPFLGLTDDPKYDNGKIPENTQTILLGMFRYQLTNQFEISGGVRRNYWSGADALCVGYDNDCLYNNMFNVDWNDDDENPAYSGYNGTDTYNPSYPAMSYDYMAGLRFRPNTKWTFSSGVVYLSEAQTDNPMERGQSNTLTIGAAGVSYNDLYPGLTVSVGGTMVRYKHQGLAPLSMPSHSAFSGVDSRIATSGEAIGTQALYVF